MSSVRAFLAVSLPTELKTSIAVLQERLKTQVAGVRWANPETIHLTLRFFGATTQETLEKVKVSMLSVKRIQYPFQVAVRGLGAFPNLHKPRVVWLGVEPEAPLQQLYKNCQVRLGAGGVATETRPFFPHLTIGRLRQRGTDLTQLSKQFEQTLIGPLPITQMVLYESRLQPNGAEHIPLLAVNFAKTTDSRQNA